MLRLQVLIRCTPVAPPNRTSATLHRIRWISNSPLKIAGPKKTTVPQAGLDTTTRAGPLAQLIVKTIIADPTGVDPADFLLYNPLNWAFPNKTGGLTFFGPTDDWLEPLQRKVINGRQDAFAPRYVHRAASHACSVD